MVKLYKYRSFNCNNPFDLFENLKIIYKSANCFNDPFDSAISFDKDEVVNALAKDKDFILDFYKFICKEEKRPFIEDEANSFINELYDHDELKKQIDKNTIEAIEYIRSEYYVYCFSTKVDDPRMWGLYSDCGKGFAVEYDYNDVLEKSIEYARNIGYNGNIKNDLVKYGKKSKQTDFMIDLIKTVYNHVVNSDLLLRYEISSTKEYDEIFFSKYDEWSNELEYRFVIPNFISNDSPIEIKLTKIKSVYMGYNIDAENEMKMKTICGKKNIDLYKMIVLYGAEKPKLDIIKIDINK